MSGQVSRGSAGDYQADERAGVPLCNPKDCGPPVSSAHGISQAQYWSGMPCPPPGDLPDPGMELASPAAPALQVDTLPLRHQGSSWASDVCTNAHIYVGLYMFVLILMA